MKTLVHKHEQPLCYASYGGKPTVSDGRCDPSLPAVGR